MDEGGDSSNRGRQQGGDSSHRGRQQGGNSSHRGRQHMSKATSIQALTWAVMDGWAWTSASAWRDTQGLSSGVCLAGHQKPRRNLGVVELRLERRGGCQCRGHLRVVDYVVHHHQPAHRVHDARLGADGPARPSVSGGDEERLARYWDTDGRRGAERGSKGARRAQEEDGRRTREAGSARATEKERCKT